MFGRVFAGLALAFIAATAFAEPSCPQFLASGVRPLVTQAAQTPPTAQRDFCFLAFTVAYSAQWREPIWSAEHITTASAELALKNPRIGSYKSCPEVAAAERSGAADYAHSGYDVGHMTPVGDFGDPDLERDTFRYCNMVPQLHALNGVIWAGIEAAVLQWALAEGDVFVVTGPLVPANPQHIGHVAIPSHTWKAVYSPRSGASAYLCSNVPSPLCSRLTIDALAQIAGVRAFPALPAAVTGALIALPQPTKGGRLTN